jgi:predicted ferric reductase
MNYPLWKAVMWVAAYVVLAAAPLLVAYLGPVPPARTFWIEFGVGLGFVGLAMMALQFVLTGRFKHVAQSLGLDTMLHFHRQIGLAGFFMVLAHPAILIAAHPEYLAFLDPRPNFARAVALWTVLVALVLLVVTTIWRQRLRIAYEWWRLGHGVLAFLVVFIGLVHLLQVQYYVSLPWKQVLWFGVTAAALALLLHARLVKPLALRRRPYQVAEVRAERGNTWTITFEPVGHPGLRFEAGQFAWLTLGDSPFSLQQHPFSFSSGADRHDRLEMTIKELGDFTSTLGDVQPGTRAFLEGPYGAFTVKPDPDVELVFITAGVGITPVMSILKTLCDRGDARRIWMIYCNVSLQSTIFLEEVRELERQLALSLTLVLEQPPPEWTGETGRLDSAILERNIPPVDRRRQYFVCGPEPMMDLAEKYLRASGVPMRDILSERFQIV